MHSSVHVFIDPYDDDGCVLGSAAALAGQPPAARALPGRMHDQCCCCSSDDGDGVWVAGGAADDLDEEVRDRARG